MKEIHRRLDNREDCPSCVHPPVYCVLCGTLSMEIVLSSFILGISYGFILFLLGTGLSLTMGLMKIINLAHGAIYMVGAYVGLTVARQTQNFLLGVLAGGIALPPCLGL